MKTTLSTLFFTSAIIINILNISLHHILGPKYSYLEAHNRTSGVPLPSSKKLVKKVEIIRNISSSEVERNKSVEDFGISACLLVRDENENLVEWLAYHYFTLPLRNLVIAIDPASLQSPMEILDRWRKMNMDIVVWANDDFMPKRTRGILHNATKSAVIRRHRFRQACFVKACMKYHKNKNRSWTILIDPDEFIILNKVTGVEPGNFFENKNGKKWVFNPKGEFNSDEKNRLLPRTNGVEASLNKENMIKRTNLPNLWTTTIKDILEEERKKFPWNESACVSLPRFQFGTTTSNDVVYKKISIKNFAKEYFEKFKTLKFFKHAEKGNYLQNKYGKVIVDVSRLKSSSLIMPFQFFATTNIHNPVEECGGARGAAFPIYIHSLFRVNHYTSTVEEYSSETKPHHDNEKIFKKKSKFRSGVNFDMLWWLKKFVGKFGLEKTKELLYPLSL